MPDLTPAELEAIRERCDAATEGPWKWWWPSRADAPVIAHPGKGLLIVLDAARRGMNGAEPRFAVRAPTDRGGFMRGVSEIASSFGVCRPDWFDEIGNADGDFIIHARTDVPLLVAEVERLRAENELLRAMLRVTTNELIGLGGN